MELQDVGQEKRKELRNCILDRFAFQNQCVGNTTGIVLNVGSKEDPAHLKGNFGDRVLNCDITTWDSDYRIHVPIDVVMDCRNKWPFDDNYAELVVMGDILEHLYEVEAHIALKEAARVAIKICITVPMNANSHRLQGGAELWVRPEGGRGHCMDWGVDNMTGALRDAGWQVIQIHVVDGVVVPEGLLVEAERI